jgi:hypothetical protein
MKRQYGGACVKGDMEHRIPHNPHQTPIQALKTWREKKPELFVKRVYERAGLDT